MSVVSGSPVRSLTAASVFRPSRRPGPRNDLPEVRLALSNDALNTSGSSSRSASSASASAMRSVRSCDSITHGPRIHNSGRPGPHSRSPIRTGCIAFHEVTSSVGVGELSRVRRQKRDASLLAPSLLRADAYFFNSTGSWSILAARMKSFSVRPPTACVESSMATLR